METPTPTPTQPRAPSLLRTPLPMWLVGVLMAVSFGAGIMLQVVAPDPAPTTAPGAPTIGEAPPLPLDVAPPLRDDQFDAELPEGHPPIVETDDLDPEGEDDVTP